MADNRAKGLADKLLVGGFTRAGPETSVLSDPIADTPMVVTLDQLRPYDLNPRITRNPRYEEIKSSIQERGLDAPPPITRRPGDSLFMIRNGGNTRLAILRELWTETKTERFFRITCLFRPWVTRGEIVALTGHLAENELHGELSFIERALGIEKAREIYEQETGQSLSQRELARRLTADGYPIALSLINRMQDAVHHLLPAIPSVLYAGLGRPQVERLIALRKAAARCWERHAGTRSSTLDFATVFQDVLTLFEAEPKLFHVQRVQDELLGRLSNALQVPYGTLTLEIVNEAIQQGSWTHATQRALPDSNAPVPEFKPAEPTAPPARTSSAPAARPEGSRAGATTNNTESPLPRSPIRSNGDTSPLSPSREDPRENHFTSAETTSRLGPEALSDVSAVAKDLPVSGADNAPAVVQKGIEPHQISDVWYIEPSLDASDHLRTRIAQLATDIAQEAELTECIESTSEGVGFVCASTPPAAPSAFQSAVLALLNAVSAPYTATDRTTMHGSSTVDDISVLLQGAPPFRHGTSLAYRLSDTGILKYFRLTRLARRLLELEWTALQTDGKKGL